MILDHPKTLKRIDELFVFVSSDADGEGVPAIADGPLMLPLICADRERVDSLREVAAYLGHLSGNKITLVRFSVREDIEVIAP